MRVSPATDRARDPAARLQRALDLAFGHLSRRDRTEHELQRYLEGKKVEPAIITDVLGTLREQGYLDDARYARRFCDDRRRLDGWGAERIERRLQAAGVEPSHVETALAVQGPAAELEAAVGVLRRRLRRPPEDDRARRRALGLLLRRGYELELAHDALRAFARGEEA